MVFFDFIKLDFREKNVPRENQEHHLNLAFFLNLLPNGRLERFYEFYCFFYFQLGRITSQEKMLIATNLVLNLIIVH